MKRLAAGAAPAVGLLDWLASTRRAASACPGPAAVVPGGMRIATAWLAAVALALAGCSPDSKHEILSKAEDVRTKVELEAALGAPDDRDKVGPLETWTYRARDGEVTFVITGDTVRLMTAD